MLTTSGGQIWSHWFGLKIGLTTRDCIVDGTYYNVMTARMTCLISMYSVWLQPPWRTGQNQCDRQTAQWAPAAPLPLWLPGPRKHPQRNQYLNELTTPGPRVGCGITGNNFQGHFMQWKVQNLLLNSVPSGVTAVRLELYTNFEWNHW